MRRQRGHESWPHTVVTEATLTAEEALGKVL